MEINMKKTIAIAAFALSTLIGASAAMADGSIYISGYSGWQHTAFASGSN
jgi:hypothetical protein